MRTPRILNDFFSRIAEVGHSMNATGKESLGDLCDALLTGYGEATGLAQAAQIFSRYAALDEVGKLEFFQEAAQRFGIDESALTEALANRQSNADVDGRMIHYASEPRSQELIRRLNRVPGGTRALVDMRADLLVAAKQDQALRQLDADFRHLFESWFNRGFLELRRIDWESSAATLEKIIEYEAVHAIDGWDDLHLRVAAADRRLYAFFHPALADDPLIFVEVALTDKRPSAVQPIITADREIADEKSARDAEVAVFYSISNCQVGLRGVSFGSFLIKQVVEELQGEFKSLKTFLTLSPVPSLRRWAVAECARGDDGLLNESQRATVRTLAEGGDVTTGEHDDALCEITARYLVRDDVNGLSDKVARFHLGNGARLECINANADQSERGLRNAWGVMVNYLYDLGEIEKNHEAFVNHGEIIHASRIGKLLKNK